MKTISVLKNPVQEYTWGSKTALPELLGMPSPSEKPQAELWMGAHLKAPSQVCHEGIWQPLPQWIEEDPPAVLGKTVSDRFSNRLPFLFKVLAAAKPLSIQAHPDLQQAREGFSRENEAGLPPDAPHRNYRDGNHKPEIICALTDFWALNGFRKPEDILEKMNRFCLPELTEELSFLRNHSDAGKLKRFFDALMSMKRERQRKVVEEVLRRVNILSETDPVAEWMIRLNEEYPGDIGVLSPLFLHLVKLRPGEAMYLPAGDLHAYLDGVGMELMANSDNVLRGGLTPKHIDVPELLRIIRFEEKEPEILTPKVHVPGESVYSTPAEEFVLSVIYVDVSTSFTSLRERSVEIMICTEGEATVTDSERDNSTLLKRGTSVVIPASVERYHIRGNAILYKAGVP